MGLHIRQGEYQKFVRFSGRTIKAGECAVVWNNRGEYTKIEGPKRVWLFYSTIRFLTRVKAEKDQYLEIHHDDGKVEHVYGPVSLYKTPFHDKITVCDGIHLESSHDCILVRRGDLISKPDSNDADIRAPLEKQTTSSERIVKGPSVFLPAPDEVIHTFRWSNVDNYGYLSKDPVNTFKVLKANQKRNAKMVLQITTLDAIQLLAELNIEYKIESVLTCIESQDPIRIMFGALRSDVVQLGENISSEDVRTNPSKISRKLSQLSSYPSLPQAASLCGISVESVSLATCRFESTEVQQRLQMQDKQAAAISSKLALLSKSRELREAETNDRLHQIKVEADIAWEKKQTDAKLAEQSQAFEEAVLARKLAQKEKVVAQEFETKEKMNAIQVNHLVKLHDATGLDVTKVLCAQWSGGARKSPQNPSKSKEREWTDFELHIDV